MNEVDDNLMIKGELELEVAVLIKLYVGEEEGGGIRQLRYRLTAGRRSLKSIWSRAVNNNSTLATWHLIPG